MGIGVSMRSSIKSSRDYFQAGRALSTWLCAVAFMCSSLGALEVLGMGAAGASFGFRPALYFLLGGVPALLLSGLFVMPLYYGSGATSLPGYLGLRFDAKTRTLSAALFSVMSLASAGISLFMVARIFQAMRIFDRLFFAYGWPREGIFLVCILMAAVPVFVYVLVAGLRATIAGQVVQFALLVAGFLPVVYTGLKNIGGWSVLSASLATLAPPAMAHAGPATIALAALAAGLVFGTARWITDFRVLQMAMAAKDAASARTIPVFAAAFRLVIPFIFILPGAIAISLPTPQTKTVVRNENGAIYHEITIVPREISAGRGVVPAFIDPETNNPRLDAAGHTRLDYGMASPNLLGHFATSGLLGLVIAALLASLMSGLASSVSAVSTVFICDIYQPLFDKSASDSALLRAARWASAIGVLVSVAVAFVIAAFSGGRAETMIAAVLASLILVFSLFQAPQLATFVLGVFTRRTSGSGAFAGLIAGFVVALLHYGLTLPANAQPGLQGGWLAVIHRYPGIMAQSCFTLLFSSIANLAVAWLPSRRASSPAATGLESLVYPPAADMRAKNGWKRPETLAVGVLFVTLVLALAFAF